MTEPQSCIIIGCGLVGALAAHFFVKLGYKVTIYEKRPDPRTSTIVEGRSINLALSNRGRRSLRMVNMEDIVLKAAVPMTGRYIHSKTNKKCVSNPYDSVSKQCLYSISRQDLNIQLINALDKENVSIYFEHKLLKVNPTEGSITLDIGNNTLVSYTADVIIAADGAFSTVRTEIQKSCVFDYSQTFVPYGYVELTINKEQGLRMVQNHLHIWPRGTFMLIALPNHDNSWTVTLFMPFTIFEALQSKEDLIKFFDDIFPDFLNYTSTDRLCEDFFRKKAMPLVSIKCSPFHFGKVVMIGDAAHAMVPFYAQGMNAGFEDCRILFEALQRFEVGEALRYYSRTRKEDAHTICDLAMYNYLEMRNLVDTFGYRARKCIDNLGFRLMPKIWIPLYNSVSFSDMGYKLCCENRAWQDRVIRNLLVLFAFIISVLILILVVINA